jgi:hypothetical protein
MKNIVLFCTIYTLCCSNSCTAATSGSKTLASISDFLCVATPGTAIISSLASEQPVRTCSYTLQLTSQELFVEGAKAIFSHISLGIRPGDDADDTRDGFISSHVSATTSGAIKLWKLYPDNYAVKTISAASVVLVGFQRIEGKRHNPL